MRKVIGTKSKYCVVLFDYVEYTEEVHYFQTELEMGNFYYELDDSQLFKAYRGTELYCKHKKA